MQIYKMSYVIFTRVRSEEGIGGLQNGMICGCAELSITLLNRFLFLLSSHFNIFRSQDLSFSRSACVPTIAWTNLLLNFVRVIGERFGRTVCIILRCYVSCSAHKVVFVKLYSILGFCTAQVFDSINKSREPRVMFFSSQFHTFQHSLLTNYVLRIRLAMTNPISCKQSKHVLIDNGIIIFEQDHGAYIRFDF